MRRDVPVTLNVSRGSLGSLYVGTRTKKVKIQCKGWGGESEREDSSMKDHWRSQSTWGPGLKHCKIGKGR